MGEISCSNGISQANGADVKNIALTGYRKSCWYEEEIEENLRWSFALNRYTRKLNQIKNIFPIYMLLLSLNIK